MADYGLSRTSDVMLGAHERASSSGSRKRSRTSHGAGRLRWTAPELLRPPADGGDPFTEASDVYRSVGFRRVGTVRVRTMCG